MRCGFVKYSNAQESHHGNRKHGTIVKGLSNLKPFRIKIILKRILLKDETKKFKMNLVLRFLIQIRFIL